MSYPRGVESQRADLSIHLAEIHGPGCSLRSKLRNGKTSRTSVGGGSGPRFRPLQQTS